MSVRRLHSEQPASFDFSAENLEWAQRVIKRYPEGRQASAVIPILMRAQEQEGWISKPAIEYVADMLSMPYIRVLEVATFYTQFQLQPVGAKAHIQVCGTTPCMLRGAEDLIRVCKNKIANKPFTLSEDGNFSWEEVECAGTCVNAPMIQIFKDTYEDLTPEILEDLIAKIDAGKEIKPGSQQEGRIGSAPAEGPVTLTDPALYDGSVVKYGLGAGIPEESAEESQPADQLPVEKAVPKETDAKAAASEAKPGVAIDKQAHKTDGDAPALLEAPADGVADNLKEISGIGPKIEAKLNGLGVYHFSQIAAWTDENCAFVDAQLSFRGRIARENWIEQAKTLAAGGETDFSKRVEAGEVDSSKSKGDS
ncbi:NADH-quinone oxidoreductase subunit NuoE [Cohaesibacter sp. CAU 1516]|uniref:NADH-quinone oxidoreductase subunit NuoE n=1 Tax=Cohaesibacter sp. CAU 1516 TaxID=2576038 RepID=UPI0010FED5AD|nr:NADH-quinone oxidoreductase subunit NuoE [Cohaesibacter sp. CAU 1516]TLP49000.1 NADH-quinone oxidoreductase subunit NuoE [Cohaesibacter sp. CAU 1516]